MTIEAAAVSGEGTASEQSGAQQASQDVSVQPIDMPLGPDEEIEFESSDDEGAGASGDDGGSVSDEETGGEQEAADDGAAAEAEGDEKGGPKKLSASERIQDLTHKNRELADRLAEVESRFEQQEKQRQQQPPQFFDVDPDKFNAHIVSLREKAEDLDLEGKKVDAARVHREIDRLLDAYDDNEAKRQQWENEQRGQEQAQVREREFLGQFERGAEFFREHSGISPEEWNARSDRFAAMLEKDPILKEEFRDRARTQGVIATIRWASDYVVKNMGKVARAQREQKEDGKEKIVGGASAGANVRSVKVSSFQQLMNLGSKAVQKYKQTNPKHYQQLLDKHMAR